MDRKYKAPEKVNVYRTLDEMNQGRPALKTLRRVPCSSAGMDYYRVDGSLRPGWRDKLDPTADACVALEGAGSA